MENASLRTVDDLLSLPKGELPHELRFRHILANLAHVTRASLEEYEREDTDFHFRQYARSVAILQRDTRKYEEFMKRYTSDDPAYTQALHAVKLLSMTGQPPTTQVLINAMDKTTKWEDNTFPVANNTSDVA